MSVSEALFSHLYTLATCFFFVCVCLFVFLSSAGLLFSLCPFFSFLCLSPLPSPSHAWLLLFLYVCLFFFSLSLLVIRFSLFFLSFSFQCLFLFFLVVKISCFSCHFSAFSSAYECAPLLNLSSLSVCVVYLHSFHSFLSSFSLIYIFLIISLPRRIIIKVLSCLFYRLNLPHDPGEL